MATIDASNARTHFSSLLERVAQGESITVTRHGTPVARLMPIAPAADQAKRAEAIRRLKEFAQRHTLGGISLKKLRDEGRK